MATISDRTRIPLGLAVIAIGGTAAWAMRTDMKIATLEIQEVDRTLKYSEICRLLHNIDNRLSVLESEIKRIRK